MKRIWSVVAVALLVGCSSPVSTLPEDLAGSWAESEPLAPRGSMIRTLTFDADAHFVWRVDLYGLYPEDDGGDLSSWSETRGRCEVELNRLSCQQTELTTYDTFYDDPGPFTEEVEGALFLHEATFEIRADELVLRYLSDPGDGPVETIMRLERI